PDKEALMSGRDTARHTRGNERRRVFWSCVPVILVFSVTDAVALHAFPFATLWLRLLWAALLVAAGAAYPHLSGAQERWVNRGLAVSSSVLFSLLAQRTGGPESPLFHWILAMPLVIA